MGNTNKLKLFLAEKFLESFVSENIWVFVGKPNVWSNESSPDTFTDTLLAEIENWDDIMSVQRVSDVSLVVPYTTIASSASFVEFTDDSDLFDDASADTFYGVTSSLSRNVYKCISNNNTTVSDIPDLMQEKVIKSTNDGYVWKFMYHISASDWDKYQTPTGSTIGGWIPVKTITKADDSAQWDHAMKGAVDGEILHVATTATDGFKDSTGNPFTAKLGDTVHINRLLTGDGLGTGFVGKVSQHSIGDENFYIDVTSPGSGYRTIETVETFNGSTYDDENLALKLRPIISPLGGHGFSAVDELGGFRVMISVDLSETMVDFIKQNDFRKIGLIVNPYTAKSSLDYVAEDLLVSGNKYRESVNARQLVKAVIDQTSWGQAGDGNTGVNDVNVLDQEFTLYDKDGNVTSTKGRVVESNPETGENRTLYLLTTQGSFDVTASATTIRGYTSSTDTAISTLYVTSYKQENLKKYTGKIIYVDNIIASNRSNGTQKLKLVLEF